MLKYQNSGGYVDLAGYHGIPKKCCQHDYPLFLPWHRIYLSRFEKGLQAIDPLVSLPYWDWSSADSQAKGMPPAFTDDTFVDTDGLEKPNPLRCGPINDGTRSTVRHTYTSLAMLIGAAGAIPKAQNQPDFPHFTGHLQGPHSSIHVWVGGPQGDMSTSALAAFDPIFWSHHAMVDFQWAKWQKKNPGAHIDGLAMTLKGFEPITVGDVLDHTNALLNYTYDGLTEQPSYVDYTRRKFLLINDVLMGDESFAVDIFLQWKGMEKPVFAGSFGIFGMGMPMGHGHSSMSPHAMRYQQYIDVTDVLNKYSPPPDDIKAELKGMNMMGEPVPQESLHIGKIEFIDM